MPYGAQVKKLDEVFLYGRLNLWVDPEAMKILDLKPGQTVHMETAKRIIAENDGLTRFK